MPASSFSDPICGDYGGIYNKVTNNCCANTCVDEGGAPRCRWDHGACGHRKGGRAGCCPANILKKAAVCGVGGAVAPCNLPGEPAHTGLTIVGRERSTELVP